MRSAATRWCHCPGCSLVLSGEVWAAPSIPGRPGSARSLLFSTEPRSTPPHGAESDAAWAAWLLARAGRSVLRWQINTAVDRDAASVHVIPAFCACGQRWRRRARTPLRARLCLLYLLISAHYDHGGAIYNSNRLPHWPHFHWCVK